MLRMTLLLCIFLFVTLLVGGRDYGQMRPGLAKATAAPDAVVQPVEIASLDADAPPLASAEAEAAPPPPPVAHFDRVELVPVKASAEAVPEHAEPARTILYVTATQVNVRSGPSTAYPVVGRLSRGEAALLSGAEEAGWAPLRIEGDGIEGYVSTRYLTDRAPFGD